MRLSDGLERIILRQYTGNLDDPDSLVYRALRQGFYPIWGWDRAEAAADELFSWIGPVTQQGISAMGGPRDTLRPVGHAAKMRDVWVSRIHKRFSLSTILDELHTQMFGFFINWWQLHLGEEPDPDRMLDDGFYPAPNIDDAQARGVTLWRAFMTADPVLVVPEQAGVHGLAHAWIDPRDYGAGPSGFWLDATRPGGLPSVLAWLNECEQRFFFSVLYMQFAFTHQSFIGGDTGLRDDMERTLIAMIRLRVDEGYDTMHPDIMGHDWSRSWVTMAILRTRPGQNLAQPST